MTWRRVSFSDLSASFLLHVKHSFFDPCLACKLVEPEIVKFRWITVFDSLPQHFQIVSEDRIKEDAFQIVM